MSLALVAKCVDCGGLIECKSLKQRCKIQRCQKCKDGLTYQSRKFWLKVQRIKSKKCRTCRGLVGMSSHKNYCTDYCKWVSGMRHRHYKIILTLGDLK